MKSYLAIPLVFTTISLASTGCLLPSFDGLSGAPDRAPTDDGGAPADAPNGSFSITTSPAPIHLSTSQSTVVRFDVHRFGGFGGIVEVGLDGLPAPVAASAFPVAGTQGEIVIGPAQGATAGSYAVVVKAKSGDLTTTATLRILVDGLVASTAGEAKWPVPEGVTTVRVEMVGGGGGAGGCQIQGDERIAGGGGGYSEGLIGVGRDDVLVLRAGGHGTSAQVTGGGGGGGGYSALSRGGVSLVVAGGGGGGGGCFIGGPAPNLGGQGGAGGGPGQAGKPNGGSSWTGGKAGVSSTMDGASAAKSGEPETPGGVPSGGTGLAQLGGPGGGGGGMHGGGAGYHLSQQQQPYAGGAGGGGGQGIGSTTLDGSGPQPGRVLDGNPGFGGTTGKEATDGVVRVYIVP